MLYHVCIKKIPESDLGHGVALKATKIQNSHKIFEYPVVLYLALWPLRPDHTQVSPGGYQC